ncbi:MAG: hypothetical protein EOP86_24330, partial [Verrucomicrobiaceae bacterium]
MIRLSRFVLPALVITFVAGTAAWLLNRKSDAPASSPSGPAKAVPASFASQAAVLNLTPDREAHLDMGMLGLGSIRELALTLNQKGQGKIRQVESSCSCLQTLGAPAGEDASPLLKARYMAVRPGPVEVNLAFSRTGADGREEILTAKVTGTVGGGDPAWSEQLVEMVKAPPPPKPELDETGVVSA